MKSIEHGVNVINHISPVVMADENKNTQFINGTKKLEILVVCGNNSYAANRRN